MTEEFDFNAPLTDEQVLELKENLNNSFFDKKDKMTREQIMAQYFKPTKVEEIIRLLPINKDIKNPHFVVVYFHEIYVKATNERKFIPCPKKNGIKVPKLDENGNEILDQKGNVVMIVPECPICKRYESELAKQDKTIPYKKEEVKPHQMAAHEKNLEIFKKAGNYSPNPFYILKVIDRNKESEGIKFYRIKHQAKKKDSDFDKIQPILNDFIAENKTHFLNDQTGCDLKLKSSNVENPMQPNKTYLKVTSVIAKQKPLHTDSVISSSWKRDKKTWQDVYKIPNIPNITQLEYLEMCANDRTPYFDKTDTKNQHWVYPGRPDLDEKAKSARKMTNINDIDVERYVEPEDIENEQVINVPVTKIVTATPPLTTKTQKKIVVEDDLPF